MTDRREEFRLHTTHFDDCGCLSNEYQTNIKSLHIQLAQERDAFGKRETELMAELAKEKYQHEQAGKDFASEIEIVKKENSRLRESLEKIKEVECYCAAPENLAEISFDVTGPEECCKAVDYETVPKILFEKSIEELMKLLRSKHCYGGFFNVRIRWYSDKFLRETGVTEK